MQEYLTDMEIKKINSFIKDEKMFDAVKKVLLASLYQDGTIKKGEKLKVRNEAFNRISEAYRAGQDISNENLGQSLRGLFEGVNALEQGFAYLKLLKKEDGLVESPLNDAI
jgi:hypothetical protein